MTLKAKSVCIWVHAIVRCRGQRATGRGRLSTMHQMGPENWTLVTRLEDKHLYPTSYPAAWLYKLYYELKMASYQDSWVGRSARWLVTSCLKSGSRQRWKMGFSLLCPLCQCKASPDWDGATHILGYNFHISSTSLKTPSWKSKGVSPRWF